jgi:dienelactone hydrolase
MASLLGRTATDPAMMRLSKRYDDLAARLIAAKTITGRGDLSAAVVFTTQHTVDDSVTIAKDIRTKTFAYKRAATPCTDSGKGYRICDGSFGGFDYRDDTKALDDADLSAHAPWTIPVSVYLPATGTGPFPTLIYGHGLAGKRQEAERLGELAAPHGYAIVAIDAVEHGDHPAKSGGLAAAIDFFGLQLVPTTSLDTRKLRDNWRQSTYDKLQLLEVLRPGVDIDGDGKTDVGIANLSYLGVSLGGIMSAEFIAFAPEVKVAVPIVPGARVADIIKDSATFAPLVSAVRGTSSDGDVARLFPLVQAAIDRGDSGAYAGHMVSARLAGFDASKPQVLMQMVINDDTVSNPENRFFARSLGLPLVGDELQKIGVIQHTQALPAKGNLDATHTWGLYQYDILCTTTCPSPTEPATHSHVAANPVAIEQSLHFIDSFFTGGGPSEIIDSYRTLGVKP